jgi:hypothetical protein
MRYYYLPISAFVFPEVAGAEAISPTAGDVAGVFVGRSSYPTATTGAIPVNPINDALILYSSPVTWEYRDGSVMDYPVVIEIPSVWIDEKYLVKLELPSLAKGCLAWVYNKTIFFGSESPMRYIFRTEADKCQQLNCLLPFKEIKNIERIRSLSDSFERSRESVLELSEAIADEIKQSVFAFGGMASQFQDDLLIETRCGACLGYAIASVKEPSPSIVRIEDSLRLLSGEALIAKAKKITYEIQDRLKQLAQILAETTGNEYDLLPISVRSVFKFKGREYLRLWSHLDPVLQQCVDFIARYPIANWNWFGNEERFAFVRELWNEILQPILNARSPEILEVFRNEVLQICRYFKSPNEIEFSFKDVKSPLLQAICFALNCPEESDRLDWHLKNARRSDFCLALFGALRGYAYFSRTMLPGRVLQTTPEIPLGDTETKPKPKPINSGNGIQPLGLPEWALKIVNKLKAIFSIRKIKPKKAEELYDLFIQAVRECGSEDKLPIILSKKKGWSKRSAVYKDLFTKMTADNLKKKNVTEGDLFEEVSSIGDCGLAESANILFVEDPTLTKYLEAFLMRNLAMDKRKIDQLLEDARFLQKGYAVGGRYSADPVKNPRDNESTIRHYCNLIVKKTRLSIDEREAILDFLTERYKRMV